ncbi:hypothetical protein ALO90_200063 [Pseudomonas amygdali pv. aesculi]|nr:hypothetical protein ALO90_200063 [Pseudomonas amygdali pv. aesculi]
MLCPDRQYILFLFGHLVLSAAAFERMTACSSAAASLASEPFWLDFNIGLIRVSGAPQGRQILAPQLLAVSTSALLTGMRSTGESTKQR